jgi:hypothetical protein
MINWIRRTFQGKVAHKTAVPYTKSDLQQSILTNRNSLALVDNWIDDKAMAASYFNYGVPDFIKDKINKPIGDGITYTDLMLYIAKKYFGKVDYLEIGVSLGKNFFQMLNALDDADLTCFDIEEINPVLAKRLEWVGKTEWDTPANSIKKNRSSLNTYRFKDKNVRYLSGDVWDSNSWARMEGNRFNMIFSDALHSPEAILFEFEMLVKYRLTAEKFVIVWDDLEGKMKNAFYKIARRYDETFNIKDIYLLQVNGWIGENERPHAVGIISNFAIE